METTTVLHEPGPGAVMLAGDWHGNTGWATSLILSAGVRGIPVLLQLGDFGFWVPGRRTDDYLDEIETACARHGVTVLWVDGNHECFDALYDLPVDPATGLRPIRPHIFHLPRGLRWRWHGKTWMALGGAHSVDRPGRKPGVSWWPQERLTREEVDLAIAGGSVDVIVAHDAPDGYEIPGLPGGFPQAELYQADLHRQLVGEVVDATEPSVLYHGHYHVSYTAQRGATRIVGLADDGRSFTRSIMILDLTA
ncbi:metallophosphoesterase [Mycolicibacterium fortuitum]|uniref:metallophosphoesterase family protein n=1 Tax=Mycolicibacterium TaxID=1866885 RepID=UPI003204CB60